ncbi:MAG: glycosyltransferase [Nitrososphaera sp.]|nr:glycosyltransferase [Nitrososphaera sp.]
MNASDIFLVHLPLVIFCVGYLTIGAVSIRYVRRVDAGTGTSKQQYVPSISIVMPTFNEEKIIESRLQSLMKTTYPKDKMEILIVDSSSDNTPSIIESFSRRYPTIRLIHDTERKGLATALNQAFRACTGEIVVKMDSDLVLSNNSLGQAVSHFADPQVGAVTGRVNVANQTESSEVRYRDLHETIQKAETELDSVFMAHTFSAYRRHLMKEYKPKEYGDETIQTIHIRKQGYRVIYDPNVKFFEDYPNDSKERLRQKIRRSEGLVRIVFENTGLLFNPRYGKFGTYVYPSNLFMFVLSPILLLMTPIIAAIDLAFFYRTTYLDVLILGLMAIVAVGRRKPILSNIWTFIELQYAQLRALVNVTLVRKRDYKWKKIERVAAQQR